MFAKSVTKPGKYSDGFGLCLRVWPDGRKYWVQRVTVAGKRREIGIGPFALVTLAEARDAALTNKRLAWAGGDPVTARQQDRAVLTFAEAARKVLALHLPTWRNAKHGAQFLATLETYAFPRIGARKVADIDSADVLAVLSPIWTSKPETARRVRQRIGTVMKWAVAQGWRKDNPAESIAQALPKAAPTKANRKALPFGGISGLLATVQDSQAGVSTKLALEFLILTATRSGETRGALAAEIDWDAEGGPVWNIPASRMKAKRPHSVPLSPRAAELARQAEALGGPHLFPGTIAGRPLSDATLLKLVRELGYDVDVHGFRTSFRTWAQERTNYPREIAEAALAHTIRDKSEAAYARSDLLEKRRSMMGAWAAFVAEVPGKVVRIG